MRNKFVLILFAALAAFRGPARADFTPENAFVRDAYTIMISHFDGSLLEEVTGQYWDFGEFDGTDKDRSDEYTNDVVYADGYGLAAGSAIISAGSGGNGGLRFLLTPFLDVEKWDEGTIEWWECYQVHLPNTQNNCADFQMLNEGNAGNNYHRWTGFTVSQERYDNIARVEMNYNPEPDRPEPNEILQPTGNLTYSTLLFNALGVSQIRPSGLRRPVQYRCRIQPLLLWDALLQQRPIRWLPGWGDLPWHELPGRHE